VCAHKTWETGYVKMIMWLADMPLLYAYSKACSCVVHFRSLCLRSVHPN